VTRGEREREVVILATWLVEGGVCETESVFVRVGSGCQVIYEMS